MLTILRNNDTSFVYSKFIKIVPEKQEKPLRSKISFLLCAPILRIMNNHQEGFRLLISC